MLLQQRHIKDRPRPAQIQTYLAAVRRDTRHRSRHGHLLQTSRRQLLLLTLLIPLLIPRRLRLLMLLMTFQLALRPSDSLDGPSLVRRENLQVTVLRILIIWLLRWEVLEGGRTRIQVIGAL